MVNETPPSPRSQTLAPSVSGGDLLVVQDLVRAFGGVRAVNGCSLTVARNSVTGLIGPNGAGKSTVADLVTGFASPHKGTILFNGVNTTNFVPHRIARQGLIRTFQTAYELERMTVLENLLVAPPHQKGERLWAGVLPLPSVRQQEQKNLDRALQLLRDFDLFPLRNEYAGNLSGGQRRLLDLARAVMAQPKLLLLDEPFAGINPTLATRLGDYITALCRDQQITFLIIEHNLAMVEQICDTVLVMALGRIIAQGTLGQLRQNPAVIDAYLGEG